MGAQRRAPAAARWSAPASGGRRDVGGAGGLGLAPPASAPRSAAWRGRGAGLRAGPFSGRGAFWGRRELDTSAPALEGRARETVGEPARRVQDRVLVVTGTRCPTARSPRGLARPRRRRGARRAARLPRGPDRARRRRPVALLVAPEWDHVGAYRRALSGYDVKVTAWPLLARRSTRPPRTSCCTPTGSPATGGSRSTWGRPRERPVRRPARGRAGGGRRDHGRRAYDPAPLVVGIPRGGVPVAAEVAEALGAELDAMIVRKLGVPGGRRSPWVRC